MSRFISKYVSPNGDDDDEVQIFQLERLSMCVVWFEELKWGLWRNGQQRIIATQELTIIRMRLRVDGRDDDSQIIYNHFHLNSGSEVSE